LALRGAAAAGACVRGAATCAGGACFAAAPAGIPASAASPFTDRVLIRRGSLLGRVPLAAAGIGAFGETLAGGGGLAFWFNGGNTTRGPERLTSTGASSRGTSFSAPSPIAIRSGAFGALSAAAGITWTATTADGKATADARLIDHEWGTEIQMKIHGLPPGRECYMMVYEADGYHEIAGWWGTDHDYNEEIPASTSIHRSKIQKLELLLDDRKVALTIPAPLR